VQQTNLISGTKPLAKVCLPLKNAQLIYPGKSFD